MSDHHSPDLDFPPPSPEDRSPDQAPAGSVKTAPPAPAPYAPLPPKQKGGFGRGFGLGLGFALGMGIVVTVASLLSGVLVIIASLSLVSTSTDTASTNLTTIWGSGSKTLRAVRIDGAIMSDSSDGSLLSTGTYGQEIASQIDDMSADDASALVLLVRTPGGSISGSRAIADAVLRYQERTGHKVLVHATELSASGGVYATATADEIIADHGTFVGSIGVIMGPYQHYNGVTATSGTLLEQGVTTTGGITSEYLSAGKGKDFGNPWRAMTQEERANYKTAMDNEYRNFVAHVSKYRGIPQERIVQQMGAYLFDTARAKEYGLIDGVMGRDDFFRHAAKAAGLDPADTKVEAIAPTGGLASLLGASRPYGVALAAEQSEGQAPVISSPICGGREVLAFSGDLAKVCG